MSMNEARGILLEQKKPYGTIPYFVRATGTDPPSESGRNLRIAPSKKHPAEKLGGPDRFPLVQELSREPHLDADPSVLARWPLGGNQHA